MRVRHNLTLGGMIMLIVLACIIAAGYFWYSHARSVRIREERAAKVAAAEQKIVVYEDDNKKLLEDKKVIEAEADALEPKIKAAKETADASAVKAKEFNGYLTDFRRKMDDTRRTVDQYNRELAQKNRVNNRSASGTSKTSQQVTAAENNLKSLQKELEKIECHYKCMGRSKPSDKIRPSDEGTWISGKNSTYQTWRCKKHGYTFSTPLEYLDYKNGVVKLNAKISKCQRQVAELRHADNAVIAETQPGKPAEFNASAWNTKYAEHQETIRKAQEAASEDRKALDKLNEDKRELEAKLKDIERKVENNETAIKNERLFIADNQK